MEKLISVIIPVYNVDQYLDECLLSVVNQKYRNLEIILIDDGSTDSSGLKCDEWKAKDSRIIVLHKKNEGLGYARNTGLNLCNGEYVIFVDSDDYIDCSMVNILYEMVIESKSDTVFCGLNRVYEDGMIEKIPAVYNCSTFDGEEVVNKVLLEMIGSEPTAKEDCLLFVSVWHAIYSMQIIRNKMVKFPSERKFMSEDIAFHIDYLKETNRVAYIENCLYYYRLNNNSLSKSYDPNRFERQKMLYYQMFDKLSIFMDVNKFQFRLQRRFLGGVRGKIIDIVKYDDQNKLEKIRKVTQDKLVVDLLKNYPYHKNPLKHRIFNHCIKYNHHICLFILAKINSL